MTTGVALKSCKLSGLPNSISIEEVQCQMDMADGHGQHISLVDIVILSWLFIFSGETLLTHTDQLTLSLSRTWNATFPLAFDETEKVGNLSIFKPNRMQYKAAVYGSITSGIWCIRHSCVHVTCNSMTPSRYIVMAVLCLDLASVILHFYSDTASNMVLLAIGKVQNRVQLNLWEFLTAIRRNIPPSPSL